MNMYGPDFCFGLLLGFGFGSGMITVAWLRSRTPAPAVPCIGQKWRMEGVGEVMVTGVRLTGWASAARGHFMQADLISYEWGQATGQATLADFLRASQLIQTENVGKGGS